MFASYKNSSVTKRIIEECIQYYENNDVFLTQDHNYEQKKEEFLKKRSFDLASIQQFIRETRGSVYTDFVFGKAHVKSQQLRKEIRLNHRLVADCLYIHVPYFSQNVVEQVKTILIEQKELPYLILDLRNSLGGYTEACMAFCRLLLPKADIVTFDYKNKRTTFFSNGTPAVSYKQIFIFVNENTASCSEIAALALKRNLANVMLIGNSTVGKGCGQDFISNELLGFSFAITSFTWRCGVFGVEALQDLILKDKKEDVMLVSNDDYFNSVFRFI